MFGIRPPGLENVTCWEEMTPWQQAKIIAFNQISVYEDNERWELLAMVGGLKRLG